MPGMLPVMSVMLARATGALKWPGYVFTPQVIFFLQKRTLSNKSKAQLRLRTHMLLTLLSVSRIILLPLD